jgi:ATP-dependent Clp protease protease subunit
MSWTPELRTNRPSGPALFDEWLEAELLGRRVVHLDGCLDDATAARVAAELMLLDAAGDETIHLRVNSTEGTMTAGLMLLDTVDTVGVDIEALVLGAAEGPALWAVAVCDRRLAGARARMRLSLPRNDFAGDARSLSSFVERLGLDITAVCDRLTEVTNLEATDLRERLTRSGYLTPAEAIELGLIDAIAEHEATVLRFPRRVGFHLRD